MRNVDPIALSALRKKRFARFLRLGALVSLCFAAVAVAKLAKGDGVSEVRIWIAAALGTGSIILIGAALMSYALWFRQTGRGRNDSYNGEKEADDDRP